MLLISSNTQDINFSQDINDLLCQIDSVVASISKNKLYSERFGADVCINIEDYENLNKYRDILYQKGINSFCLKDFLIDDIVNRIKQLINRN